jgi:hypothetical protein
MMARRMDPGSREQKYSLRRILVRRLQAANRGVPRRQRVEQHIRFADEWAQLVQGRRVEEVLGFVQGKWGLDAGLEEGLIQRLATEVRPIPLEIVVRRGVDDQFEDAREGQGGGVPASGLHSSWNQAESNQRELFEPQLAANQG